MFAGHGWPSGSYGLPKPILRCPGGKEYGWNESGLRYQDMDDSDKNTSERSRVSSGSHMDVPLIVNGDVIRTFCMKQNTGIETRFWPKGKVLYMHTRTTYETAMHMLQYELMQGFCKRHFDTNWMTEWHGREQNNGIFKTMKTQCQ
jgi:hypothetical protein